MNRKVINTMKAYNMLPQEGGAVLVALSGGADSMALLHLLLELSAGLGFDICAAHVDHGLREGSGQEGLFVKNHCESLGIPVVVKTVDTKRAAEKYGLSLETAARQLRYGALEEAAVELSADRIATAHHAGDNTETLLLNLIRGTGLKGLCGIPPVRGSIIRPLLELTKEEILLYCEEKKIPFVTDESNFSLEFTRNRLRLEVVPRLLDICPELHRTAARACKNLRADEAVLHGLAAGFNDYTLSPDGVHISRKAFGELLPGVAVRVFALIFEKIASGAPLSASHIEAVLKIVSDKAPAKQIALPAGLCAKTCYDDLVICKETAWNTGEFCFELSPGRNEIPELGIWVELDIINGKKVYNSDKNSCFDFDTICDKLYKNLHIRSRREGDTYTPYGMGGRHKSLKKMMIDAKIPREKRDRLPVFVLENTILWVPGFPVNQAYCVTEKTTKTLTVSIQEA